MGVVYTCISIAHAQGIHNIFDAGSNGKVSASADLKPTLDLKSVRHETDGM